MKWRLEGEFVAPEDRVYALLTALRHTRNALRAGDDDVQVISVTLKHTEG